MKMTEAPRSIDAGRRLDEGGVSRDECSLKPLGCGEAVCQSRVNRWHLGTGQCGYFERAARPAPEGIRTSDRYLNGRGELMSLLFQSGATELSAQEIGLRRSARLVASGRCRDRLLG
jgi:hypothetical protein